MSKKERLEAIIGYYSNGKPSVFAKFLGVAPSTISSWLARDTFDYELIFAKCEIINPSWLLTGEGSMLKNNPSIPPTDASDTSAPSANPVIDRNNSTSVATHCDPTNLKQGIPLIPIEVVAGWNGIDVQGVTLAECTRYHVPDFEAAGAEYLIRVSGSSMYPKYSNGDLLACRKIHEVTFFQWGKIYVIDSNQGAMVKRLFPCETNPDMLICQSDNPKYPPFELLKSEVRSISIVIGVIRLE